MVSTSKHLSVLFALASVVGLTLILTDQTKPHTEGSRMAMRKGLAPLIVENRGQLDSDAPYYVERRNGTIRFGMTGVTFSTAVPTRPFSAEPAVRKGLDLTPVSWHVEELTLAFAGAAARIPAASDPKITRVSYYSGRPDSWIAQVPTYGRITYPDLWEGVDLICANDATGFKYTYVVAPGRSPGQIRHVWRGADSIRLTAAGEMEVAAGSGVIRDKKPTAYQEVNGRRIEVPVEYEVAAEGAEYGFKVGAYDPALPLVIDPTIVYAGYWGDAGDQDGLGIAVDSSGAAYLTGRTFRQQTNSNDIYVAKIDPTGHFLVYEAFIGGTDDDRGFDIAVDGTGAAYVTGATRSSETTFPVLGGPGRTYGGNWDAFACKLDPSANPVYCGYIGGSDQDFGEGIVVDSAGNAYVTGPTKSTESTFPVVVGPDLTQNGQFDTFVAKVKATPTDPVTRNNFYYSGFIGGNRNDAGVFGGGVTGGHIQIDNSGNAYVSGMTQSDERSFPGGNGFGTVPGFNHKHSRGYDAFIVKVNATGSGFAYATYIGGDGDDFGQGMAVDTAGNAYITGYTSSSESTFPSGQGFGLIPGFDRIFNGSYDAFAVKLNSTGASLLYATYLGGSGTDQGFGVQVDSSGSLFVAGLAQNGFPVAGGPDLTFNSVRSRNSTPPDGFVTKLDTAGTALLYSSYIGGSGDDICYWIAIDAHGNAYVGGSTNSSQASFPTGTGMGQIPTFGGALHGGYDSFVVKIAP